VLADWVYILDTRPRASPTPANRSCGSTTPRATSPLTRRSRQGGDLKGLERGPGGAVGLEQSRQLRQLLRESLQMLEVRADALIQRNTLGLRELLRPPLQPRHLRILAGGGAGQAAAQRFGHRGQARMEPQEHC
jgi:hypothetical protein